MLQQPHDVLAVDGLHRNLLCAQALADNGQIACLCLAHKQVEHVAVDQARRVALADCRPNCAHQLADRLRVKVEDTGLDADALLRMPSEERRALTELLAKYKGNRTEEDDDE